MNKKLLFGFAVLALVLAFAGRLVPHAPNFTPVGAFAVFLGMYLAKKSKWALLLPLAVMFLADLALGFYDFKIMLSVYGSFLLYGLFGMLAKRKIGAAIPAVLAGSLSFFLITNFAVWAFSLLYPATLQGLLLSYTMALPFLKYTLLGDLFFVLVFVGGYELALALLPQREVKLTEIKLSTPKPN